MSSAIVRDKTYTFPGFYRAIVTDNDDPLKSGRVKVRVLPMFYGASDDSLPWAIMADTSMGGFSNVGGSNIPVVNSHVWVFFEAGDHRYPVVFAGAPAIENGVPDLPVLSRESDEIVSSINSKRKTGVETSTGSWDEPDSAYGAQYPNNKVFKTKKGIVVEMDDTDGNVRLHFYHPSGSREEVDNDGNRVVHTEGSRYSIVIGEDKIYISGNQNISIDGDADIVVGGNSTSKIGGNSTISVEGSASVTTGGTTTITSGGNASITAPLISLN